MTARSREIAVVIFFVLGVAATLAGFIGIWFGYILALMSTILGICIAALSMGVQTRTRDRITSVVRLKIRDRQQAGYGALENQFYRALAENIFKFLNWSLVLGVIRYAATKTGNTTLEMLQGVLFIVLLMWLMSWMFGRFDIGVLDGAKPWHRFVGGFLGFCMSSALLVTVNHFTFTFVNAILELQFKAAPT
jgi:hypothetical protein